MSEKTGSLWSLFLIFLRFGFLAWGGPVAQIAMIREELVERRRWIDPDKFKRVLAVYQALPGPEAHELCVYFGMIRHGRWGGFLAGMGFMLPGFVFILLLSAIYMKIGAAALLPLFAGVEPAVTALILRAAHRIGQHTLTCVSLWFAAALSMGLTLFHVHFLWVFVICGAGQALWSRGFKKAAVVAGSVLTLLALGVTLLWHGGIDIVSEGGGSLFAEGLKAGLLSFGGAYTAFPFLKAGFVDVYPAVTPQVFLDGIALSSVIPAPLVIFGTYLGFVADGLPGAVLVTLGIFIPAFSFTLIGHGWIEKAVENPALHGMLDGIAAAVVGLLALTAFDIATQTLTGIYPALFFAAALAAFYRLRGKWVVPAVIVVCGVLGKIGMVIF